MSTETLDDQIAIEQEKLVKAQAAATKAAEQLAKDPANPKRRMAVVEAQQAIAEIQVSIDALNAAAVEADKCDTREKVEAVRAQRIATAAKFNERHAEVVKVACEIDAAFARLTGLMAELGDCFARAKETAVAYSLQATNDTHAQANLRFLLTDTPNELASSAFVKLYKVVAASNLDLDSLVTFSHTALPSSGIVGVIPDKQLGDAAAANAKRVAAIVSEHESRLEA
jgi:hypothetical protein